jgi:hypothetical protein
VANVICFSSKWPGWKVPFHPGPPTDHLEEKQTPFATHTLATS